MTIKMTPTIWACINFRRVISPYLYPWRYSPQLRSYFTLRRLLNRTCDYRIGPDACYGSVENMQ